MNLLSGLFLVLEKERIEYSIENNDNSIQGYVNHLKEKYQGKKEKGEGKK